MYGKSRRKKSKEESISKVAVKSVSLAVDAGEVFGLLGHNGAGKTTTMKIITAEEAATKGKVRSKYEVEKQMEMSKML